MKQVITVHSATGFTIQTVNSFNYKLERYVNKVRYNVQLLFKILVYH